MNSPQTATANAASGLIAALRAKLSEYDIVVGCDITGSMGEPVKAGATKTRWSYIQETLRDFCQFACSIDDDGITLGFFGGNKFPIFENVTTDKINDILNQHTPGGGTFLAPFLNRIFNKQAGGKKDLFVIFLDGEVNDRNETIAELVAQANRQTSDNECTVLFVQVGDDRDATIFLQYLDDNLQSKHGAKYDIVDTKTVDDVSRYSSFEELLANAIVD